MNQKTRFEHVRRMFLVTAAAGAGSMALSACGGAQGQTADDGPAAAPPEPAPGSGSAPSPGPSSGPAPGPAPASPPPPSSGTAPGTFTYQIEATANSAFPPGTTTKIATGATGMLVQVSPDLPPGRALSLASNGEVNIVAASGAPPADLHRPWVIEVMASPLATMFLYRGGTLIGTYGKGLSTPTTWWQLMQAAQDGDVIEVSPGAINATEADTLNYYSDNLDSCGMTIVKGVTIRNIRGRGRWRLYPAGTSFASNRNGIGIFSPTDGGDISGRLNITIEGFDLTDQFGTAGTGVRMRSVDASNWTGYHQSATFRNFKIGTTAAASLSGFSGAVEVLTIEDGHVFDCGNGSGQEHNMYISARVMTLRGVRSSRTRGWNGTPYGGFAGIEGHMAKLDAVTGLIEGCCFDAASLGDHSLMTQMKSGGNWTIRSNIYIDSQYPNVANGAINMCREMNADGVVPNFKTWAAGSEGNSLLIEKNVFVGHYPRPIVWFFGQAITNAMRPAVGGSYTTAERLQSLIVRDNIAMVATNGITAGADQWKLAGWATQDPTTRPMWISQDPNGGAAWTTRGNAVMTYGADEPGFSDKKLMRYTRTAGPVTASAGTVATARFVYPHGHEPRNDAFGGLG